MSAIIQRRANGAEIRMAGVICETAISVRPAEGRLWVAQRHSKRQIRCLAYEKIRFLTAPRLTSING
jgi:hypothetical protein